MSAKEAPPIKKDEFYVVVDHFTDHPETGELIVKQPVFRTKFLAVNRPAHTDMNGIAHQPVKVMIDPEPTNGVYSALASQNFSGEKSAIMKHKVIQHQGVILGPFDTVQEALIAKHTARPKTTREVVGLQTAELATKDEELSALRARIAQLEKGPAPKAEKKDAK